MVKNVYGFSLELDENNPDPKSHVVFRHKNILRIC